MTTADLAETPDRLERATIWDQLREAVDVTEYRPRLRDGLVWRNLRTARGDDYVIIQNPQAATYLRLTPEDFFVFELMDGSLSIRELVVAYMLKFHRFALPRVARLVQDLRYNEFLADRPYFTYQHVRRTIRRRTLGTVADSTFRLVFNREFPINGIDGFIDRVYRSGAWVLFTRPAQVVMALLTIIGVPLFVYYLLSRQLSLFPGESIARNLVGYYISFLIIAMVHEASHALTVKAYGRVVRRGGFAIFYGLPGLFVDTQDIWMESRGPRMAASWAGPYSGLILTGLTGIVLTIAPDASWATGLQLFGTAALINNLFQLMPLIQLDGYFILMDWLEIPQLRRQALRFVRYDLLAKLRRWQPFSREERIFAIFGILSAIYTAYAITLASLFWWSHASSAIDSAIHVPTLTSLLGLLLLLLVLIPFALGLVRRLLALLTTLVRALYRAGGAARQRWYRERVAIVSQTSALAGLSKEQAAVVARHFREEWFDTGAAVVRQGDLGNRFYLIVSGQAEVFAEGSDRAELLATLGPLDYFGERALLQNTPRTATVRAQSRLRVFSLGGADFRKTVAPYVGADAALRARLDERNDLERFELFEALGNREKDLLLARFRAENYAAGDQIIREGGPAGDFYCIRSGHVELSRKDGRAEPVHIATLGPGEFFGEVALLVKAPRNATVTAVDNVELWALTEHDFHEILGRYFNLESTLADVARQRLPPSQVLLESAPPPSTLADTAPDFRLESVDGAWIELAELRGKPVLVWFSRGWSDSESRDFASRLDAVALSQMRIVQVTPDTPSRTRSLQPAGVLHTVVCDPAKLTYLQYDLYAPPEAESAEEARTWWDALRGVDRPHLALPQLGTIRAGVVIIDASGVISARYVSSPSTPLPSPEVLVATAQVADA
jgi:putative peptide zinc metalloprotease protein